MTGWRHAAKAVALVAPPIVATDVYLSRRRRRLISHYWWEACGHPSPRAALAGTWATLTWHLFVPHRTWSEALAVGAVSASAVRAVCRS